ncbi:GntR family transcriptional regulator [Caballeronia sp. J97]|uniref:GntR family transcriptional regulator n=1 Tax=Caballeronia sp. J97 TaxID=2805429 RepID=UPI002AB17904|nr:GntR family transcriptional regulator [Caballeronia sp. J97]
MNATDNVSASNPFPSLQHQIFDDIKRRVITCDLLPGTEVTEKALAEEYRVTKAPIRSALSRLTESGWLVNVPRKGHVVTPLKIRDVIEIFDTRELVEPETARLSAGRISKDALGQLNAPCASKYRFDDTDAKRRFLLANAAFHVGIARACGNSRLAQMLELLHVQSLRVLYLSIGAANRSVSWKHGYQSMIDVLVRGDGEAAAFRTLAGIKRSREAVMDIIKHSKGEVFF